MEDLIEKLKESPQEALTIINKYSKDDKCIADHRKEYTKIDRNIRDTQIGKVQKDKSVGEGEKRRLVKSVRIPIPFQNYIVENHTAFEVAEPVTLISNEQNELKEEVERIWKNNRLDAAIMKMVEARKSETQTAISFYMKEINKDNWINKTFGLNKKWEIKTKILENKNGKMTPIFDLYGDMKLFCWEFNLIDSNDKTTQYLWVYDDKYLHKCKSIDGKLTYEKPEKHGFSKIPIVYSAQENVEWFQVQKMIDRLEVAVSKLGAANDYTAHPILLLYGEVEGAADKDEDGKALRMNMVEDEDSGKISHGDAKYLTRENSAETSKLEFDRLEKYIHSLSSSPDLSFENVKGLGSISGVAIKLMFLDAIIKAKKNNVTYNQVMIERMINVIISGIVTTLATNLKSEASGTLFEIQFNSILPNDLKETVETYSRAVESGLMSVRTAVKSLDMSEDSEKEISTILKEKKEKQPEPSE